MTLTDIYTTTGFSDHKGACGSHDIGPKVHSLRLCSRMQTVKRMRRTITIRTSAVTATVTMTASGSCWPARTVRTTAVLVSLDRADEPITDRFDLPETACFDTAQYTTWYYTIYHKIQNALSELLEYWYHSIELMSQSPTDLICPRLLALILHNIPHDIDDYCL